MKKSRYQSILGVIAMALCGALAAQAAVPAGYYASLEGKKGAELRRAVRSLIRPHNVIHYGEPSAFAGIDISSWVVFRESDVRTVSGYLMWWDMYSANNVRVSDGHPGLNIEHSVANSWWGGDSGSHEAYNDLHHLNPSNGTANNQKSNLPLGEVASASWTNNVCSIGAPKQGLGGGSSKVFEPADVYKGDFARAYFYIFTIYNDIPWKDDSAWMYTPGTDMLLQPWAYNMLLSWAQADPVSYKEIDRNDVIYEYQENRNPFIDCPDLADYLFGSKQNEPFTYKAYTPAGDDPDYPGSTMDFLYGQWAPVSSDADLNTEDFYIVVCPSKGRAMASYTVSNGNAMDECKNSVLNEIADHPEIITAVPTDIAYVKLESASAGGWYVGVYDADENFKGYIATSSKNTAKLNSNRGANGTLANITVTSDKTSIVYDVSGTAYELEYNSGQPRFASYTFTQNPIRLYRPTDEDFTGDSDPSGILDVEAVPSETVIFDLNGCRVTSPSKGIYIVNGKKVVL